MEDVFLQFRNDSTGGVAIVEDDGKTAYAYLMLDGKIVADVWLYNVVDAPAISEWPNGVKAPFANAAGFASEESFERLRDASEVEVEWSVDSGLIQEVRLFLRERHHATLWPGSRPGRCRLASKEGPLARLLEE